MADDDGDELAPVEDGSFRCGMGAAVVDGKIYIMGGHNGDTPLKLAEKFEPSDELDGRGRWTRLPPMQARRSYCSVCANGGMIFVVGGSADGRTLNTFEVFDPRKGEWAVWFTKPPMHTKRTMHACGVVDGRMVVCGGIDGVRDLSLVEEFEQASNVWCHKDRMSSGRSYFAMAVAGKQLYAIGGQNRHQEEDLRTHAIVERFDLWSERWFEVPPLLQPRIGCGAATLLGEDGEEYIYAVGGSDGTEAIASMECFDLREEVWTEAPPMAVARLGLAVAVVNNRLYAIGGFDGKEPLDTFECFDPKLNKWGPVLKMGGD